MSTAKRGGHKLRNDIIFISVLLILVSVVGICFYLIREEGDSVTVTVNGKFYASYSLSKNITVDIRTGENDEHSNILVISDGKAYISSASCPDGLCSSHKPIHRSKESIVCLPNKVAVTVNSPKHDNSPDVVV